jgi:hypothetical protein
MISITNLVTVLGVAIGATSIAIAVYQYRRTVHRDIFRVYADKYDSILQPEIYPLWQEALAGDDKHWERLTPVMIAYLNLIWEECYLVSDGVIPNQLWDLWWPEIQKVLCSDFARQIIRNCDFHFPENLTRGSRLELVQIAGRNWLRRLPIAAKRFLKDRTR